MVDPLLVSVVTPTFPGRERELLRCMEGVLDLDWPNVQHVIVSDRTDRQPLLTDEWEQELWRPRWADYVTRAKVTAGIGAEPIVEPWMRYLTFVQINESWRN